MKMAEAVKKKQLKPGHSIPGCNSYFLCKYLKDTMLQAKTYLFCAIRPEVQYHRYTFSTLGFATVSTSDRMIYSTVFPLCCASIQQAGNK
jgi:hypothetical protein